MATVFGCVFITCKSDDVDIAYFSRSYLTQLPLKQIFFQTNDFKFNL